jgi:hypothetical protein
MARRASGLALPTLAGAGAAVLGYALSVLVALSVVQERLVSQTTVQPDDALYRAIGYTEPLPERAAYVHAAGHAVTVEVVSETTTTVVQPDAWVALGAFAAPLLAVLAAGCAVGRRTRQDRSLGWDALTGAALAVGYVPVTLLGYWVLLPAGTTPETWNGLLLNLPVYAALVGATGSVLGATVTVVGVGESVSDVREAVSVRAGVVAGVLANVGALAATVGYVLATDRPRIVVPQQAPRGGANVSVAAATYPYDGWIAAPREVVGVESFYALHGARAMVPGHQVGEGLEQDAVLATVPVDQVSPLLVVAGGPSLVVVSLAATVLAGFVLAHALDAEGPWSASVVGASVSLGYVPATVTGLLVLLRSVETVGMLAPGVLGACVLSGVGGALGGLVAGLPSARRLLVDARDVEGGRPGP